MGVLLRIAEPTGMYRRSLRRYVSSADDKCPARFGYHNASVDVDVVTEAEHTQIHGDNWPHDDPRWPETCECGYIFTEQNQWQRNDYAIYRLPDGTEFAFSRSLGQVAPPGTMIRIPWHDEFAEGRGESWCVALPDGGDWITTQAATGGGFWTVSGTPPLITVSPSIWHNSPSGWHGFINNGEMTPA